MADEALTKHPDNIAGKSPLGGEPPAPRRGWWLPSGPVLGLVTILLTFAVLIFLKDGAWGLRSFVGLRNWQVIVHEGTITAVIALGSLLIIISGGIDLSVGSVVALVTVVTMLAYAAVFRQTHSMVWASLAAVPVGVLVGGGCGLVNGLVITGLRVSPFVTTLGMLSIARGLALWLAERKAIDFPGGLRPGWVRSVTQVHAPTVFNPGFWSLAGLAVVVAVLLRYMVLGRYAYAIGSSEPTARLCGVPIARTKIVIYTLAGLLTGWAGILRFASVGGDPSGSVGLELEVIAAAVIGGASLSGGLGTVGGTLVGVLILGLLLNGVRLLDMPVDIRYVLIGGVIIISTALSRWRSGKEE
jgi:ribose/xylose/arabinose/galactoside ABC-type transport system permease subunit